MQSYENMFIDVNSSEKQLSSTSEKKRTEMKRKALVKYIRKEKKRKQKKTKQNERSSQVHQKTKKSYILSVSIIKADLV